jgi:Fur family transcriptional regulator, ferric uptake regulator
MPKSKSATSLVNQALYPLTEQWVTELRHRGFRVTPQREKILMIFEALPEGEHLSAEALQDLLKKAETTDASLATTYRTLKLLASLGVLRELDFAEDHKHYELARTGPEEQHQHLICIHCGYTEEFVSPQIFDISKQIAEAAQFELVDNQLKLYGRCHDCQNAKAPFMSPREKKERSPHASGTLLEKEGL